MLIFSSSYRFLLFEATLLKCLSFAKLHQFTNDAPRAWACAESNEYSSRSHKDRDTAMYCETISREREAFIRASMGKYFP